MSFTSKDIRKRILKMANESGRSAHIGGSLSMVEIINVLYNEVMNYDYKNPRWEDRDRLILSKGHCVLGLYALLVEANVISEELALEFLQDGGRLTSHPTMDIDIGIEYSSGSLGQGISFAVGLAKAGQIRQKNYKIYTIIGNGETNEGSVWEAAMLAAQWKLDNLTVIMDNNRIQSDGGSFNIISLNNVSDAWKALGFKVIRVDGHNEEQIKNALEESSNEMPKLIICDTVKGKGVLFMENNNDWHHNRLSDKLYVQAIKELNESI